MVCNLRLHDPKPEHQLPGISQWIICWLAKNQGRGELRVYKVKICVFALRWFTMWVIGFEVFRKFLIGIVLLSKWSFWIEQFVCWKISLRLFSIRKYFGLFDNSIIARSAMIMEFVIGEKSSKLRWHKELQS